MAYLKRFFLVFLLLLIVLSACRTATDAENTGAEDTTALTEAATDTPVPATNTPVPATATPEPTATETAEPTETATAEPTDTPEPTDTVEPMETAEPTRRATATAGARAAATESSEAGDEEEETEATATVETPESSEEDSEEITDSGQLPDTQTILEKSAEAAQSIETLTQEQVTIITSETFTQTQHQICIQDLPDHGYCQLDTVAEFPGLTEPITQSIEMLMHEGTFWLREAGQETWEELPEDFMQQAGFAENFEVELSANLDLFENPVLVGERETGGVAVYEIEAEVSPDLFSLLLNEEMAEEFLSLAEDIEMAVTIWIGTEDFITRKQEMTMHMTIEGETLDVVSQVANSGINEPVEIPDPPESE